MTKIFVSYRRVDANERAHHIADWLVSKYGRQDVFIDVDNIPGGANFAQVIETSIEKSDVVLVVIGHRWVEEMHRRALLPETDYVRFEVHRAQSYSKFVIPVLLDRSVQIDTSYLPPDMQTLTRLNYMYARSHPDFHQDMHKIYREIERKFPLRRMRRYLGMLGFVASMLVCGLFIAFGIRLQNELELARQVVVEPTRTLPPTLTLAPTVTMSQPTATAVPIQATTVALSPLEMARTPVISNREWKPYEDTFEGVTMVLVPAGCFMMGSPLGEEDELPVHRQCFDMPFWIDKYEITNQQYGSIGCSQWSSQPNQPRTCINWFDARGYCVSRGARLPTEKEWEYAARGPSSWKFPWGNDWDASRAVWLGNSNDVTATVGSRPSGASWVGAMDMSGNVWEWTSSLYLPYEYNGSHENASDQTSKRAIKGGAFSNPEVVMRSADRYDVVPGDVGMGFRCVRS